MTKNISKKKLTNVIVVYEIIGFAIVILFIWANELFDIPRLFGAVKTPVNWVESIFETILTLSLCAVIIFFTRAFLAQIKYLEGFLPVCALCKRIRVKNNWIPIEKYIKEHSEAEFTHSLCPDCVKEHYSPLFKSKE